MVEIWTSHMSTRDPDRLDITRKSAGPEGEPFAPSRELFMKTISARGPVKPWRAPSAAEEAAWTTFVPVYVEEMRVSYRRHRAAWERVLARARVVFVCYCLRADRCHRSILSGLFGKCGATVRGELAA